MRAAILFLLVVAGILLIVGWVVRDLRRMRVFMINVERNGVALQGRVPKHSDLEVREFVNGLGLPSGAWISAHPSETGFTLSFSPEIRDEARQRLRNFLYN